MTTQREYHEVDGVIFCDRMGCPGSNGLRCYRTGVPICQKCSVRTPVGYLSKDAAREQQNMFYNAEVTDYILAGVTSFIVSLFAGGLVSFLPFFIAFLLAVPAGGVVAEAVWRVLRKRRGRYTAQVVAGGMVLSILVLLFVTGNLFSLMIYALMGIGTATARFQLGLRV